MFWAATTASPPAQDSGLAVLLDGLGVAAVLLIAGDAEGCYRRSFVVVWGLQSGRAPRGGAQQCVWSFGVPTPFVQMDHMSFLAKAAFRGVCSAPRTSVVDVGGCLPPSFCRCPRTACPAPALRVQRRARGAEPVHADGVGAVAREMRRRRRRI
eukprot:gene23332-biopygen7281